MKQRKPSSNKKGRKMSLFEYEKPMAGKPQPPEMVLARKLARNLRHRKAMFQLPNLRKWASAIKGLQEVHGEGVEKVLDWYCSQPGLAESVTMKNAYEFCAKFQRLNFLYELATVKRNSMTEKVMKHADLGQTHAGDLYPNLVALSVREAELFRHKLYHIADELKGYPTISRTASFIMARLQLTEMVSRFVQLTFRNMKFWGGPQEWMVFNLNSPQVDQVMNEIIYDWCEDNSRWPALKGLLNERQADLPGKPAPSSRT